MKWSKAAETALRQVSKRNGFTAEETAAYRAKCETVEKNVGETKVSTFTVYMLAPDGELLAVAKSLTGSN